MLPLPGPARTPARAPRGPEHPRHLERDAGDVSPARKDAFRPDGFGAADDRSVRGAELLEGNRGAVGPALPQARFELMTNPREEPVADRLVAGPQGTGRHERDPDERRGQQHGRDDGRREEQSAAAIGREVDHL